MLNTKYRGIALSIMGCAAVGALALQPLTAALAHRSGGAAGKVAFGKPIPDFTLPDAATGKKVSFSDLATGRKATVVVFMSTHCPVSNAYERRIEQIATRYEPAGVKVIGVFPDVGEDAPEVAEHAQQHGLTFTCLRDASYTVTDEFYATCTPEVYVADSKGALVYHGPVDDSQNPSDVSQHYLTDTLDAVLAGKAAPVQSKRAFGCQIHRG